MIRPRPFEAEAWLPDVEATRALGRALGEILEPGDVLALTGPLGAGKTCLVQGLALGLRVPVERYPVISPTFGLIHEYPGRLTLHHMDFYRLQSVDLDELGLDELLEGDGACAVEWPERSEQLEAMAHARIELTHERAGRLARLQSSEERFVRAFQRTGASLRPW